MEILWAASDGKTTRWLQLAESAMLPATGTLSNSETHRIEVEQKAIPQGVHARDTIAKPVLAVRLLRQQARLLQNDRFPEDLEAQGRNHLSPGLNRPARTGPLLPPRPDLRYFLAAQRIAERRIKTRAARAGVEMHLQVTLAMVHFNDGRVAVEKQARRSNRSGYAGRDSNVAGARYSYAAERADHGEPEDPGDLIVLRHQAEGLVAQYPKNNAVDVCGAELHIAANRYLKRASLVG